jgi:hypothetical protein
MITELADRDDDLLGDAVVSEDFPQAISVCIVEDFLKVDQVDVYGIL